MVCIPLWIIYKMGTAKGTLREVKTLIRYTRYQHHNYLLPLILLISFFLSIEIPWADHTIPWSAHNATEAGETTNYLCCWWRRSSQEKSFNQGWICSCQWEGITMLNAQTLWSTFCFYKSGPWNPNINTSHCWWQPNKLRGREILSQLSLDLWKSYVALYGHLVDCHKFWGIHFPVDKQTIFYHQKLIFNY